MVTAQTCKQSPPLPSASKLSSLVEKCLDFIQTSPSQPTLLPDSPRSSTDESALPLSAASTVVGDMFEEKQSVLPKNPPRTWWQRTPSVHAPIFFVIMMFPVTTALVIISFWSLPFSFSWPQNLTDLAQLGRDLHGYSQSGFGASAHVVGVISIATIWMHAWSVPGSVLWNVLAGALFSPILATVLLSVLTTVGSIFATLLATPIAPFITHFFPKPLALAKSAFESDSAAVSTKAKSPAWVRLTVLRLIGIVPWSGINVACGVIGVALTDCIFGTFIGSIPWTAVTCQIGDILQTVASTPSPNPQSISSILASPSIVIKLIFLSILSLAPILGRDYLRTWISGARVEDGEMMEERVTRWTWVREWRSKVRLPSRSRSSSEFDGVTSSVDEKEDGLP